MIQNKEVASSKENNIPHIIDVLHLSLRRWYWYALSIIICSGLALTYIFRTPNTYVRNTSILIKDESSGGSSEIAVFKDMGLFKSKYNVENESEIIRSGRLMNEVVRRLNLDMSYKIKKAFRPVELYTQSPILVSLPDIQDFQSLSFRVEPISKTELRLSDFIVEGNKDLSDKPIKVALSDTLSTPAGRMVISPTLYYTEKFYNSVITVTKSNINSVIGTYAGAIQVSTNTENTVIYLSVTDESVARADDILNTLVIVYNEDCIKEKNQVAINTSKFINERLMIIEKELGAVDSDIERYKRKNLMTDLKSTSALYLSESSEYNQRIFELENQRILAKYIKGYLSDQSKSTHLIPANSGIQDIKIEGQINEYNTLLLKRDQLIANSGDQNPLVVDLNNSLNSIRQAIIRSIDNLVVTLNLQIINAHERDLQTTQRIASTSGQEKYMLSVERQQKIKESLYLYLLQKREENELTGAIQASNTRIIDYANGSNAPVAPRQSRIMLVALIVGIGLPFSVFWLMESSNTRVKGRNELKYLTAPFLGEIPLSNKKHGSSDLPQSIVIEPQSRDIINEAFRIVRTNMDFMRVKSEQMKVIMFTSFYSGSGKTFVSMNLAMSFAILGKKVAVLDLDLRKASLSQYIKSDKANNMGISNYLGGMAGNINKIIVKGSVHPNLDIIPAGTIPPNPTELLLSDRLAELFEKLRKEYDYIFVDCTPIDLVADAAIVGKLSDLTIFIIRAGLFDRRLLPDVEYLYNSDKFNNMTILLNGTINSFGRYSSGYYDNGKPKKGKDKSA